MGRYKERRNMGGGTAKGSVRYVYQTADGVLITTCEENTEQWYTYDQTGTKLDEWDRIKFDGSYGYAQDSSSGHRGICEVYNGYTYASLNSHVAKSAVTVLTNICLDAQGKS